MKAIAQSMATSDINVQKTQGLYKSIVGVNNPANGVILSATTDGSINTESTHAHGLDHIPSGFIVIGKDKAGDIYTSQAADATNIYLKCTVVTVAATVIVF